MFLRVMAMQHGVYTKHYSWRKETAKRVNSKSKVVHRVPAPLNVGLRFNLQGPKGAALEEKYARAGFGVECKK